MGLAESYRNNGSAPGVDGLDKLYPGTPDSLSLKHCDYQQALLASKSHTCQVAASHAVSLCSSILVLAFMTSNVLCAWLQAGLLTRWSLQATQTLWQS